MVFNKSFFILPLFMCVLFITALISGCQNENITEPAAQSDDEYLQSTALNTAFSNDPDDDDNLFANEVMDFDSEGPVSNSQIDSLVRWGRRVTSVNVNTSIISMGDTMKTVTVTRTITGNFIIIGYVGGNLDSTVKPFSQEQKRLVTFKRIGRNNHPRRNWRVYTYSAVDGETKTPQIGKTNITMSKIEFYKNNNLVLTLNGPDFTSNIFTSRFFGGGGLFEANRGDQIRIKVFATSNQSDTDIVSFHWARNAFGFHRESFVMTSQTPNGNNFDRTYEKTFTVYGNHIRGMNNAFISANTRSSLWNNSVSEFSSTYMGFPYRVRP